MYHGTVEIKKMDRSINALQKVGFVILPLFAFSIYLVGSRRSVRSQGEEESVFVLCCAVREEGIHAENALNDAVEYPLRLGAYEFRRIRGRVGCASVEVITMGIGMVNAAAAIAALAAEASSRRNTVTAVISFGCSGAHALGLEIGDVVVASETTPIGAYKLKSDGSKRYSGFKTTMEAPVKLKLWTDDRIRDALSTAALNEMKGRLWTGCIGSADTWTQAAASLVEMHGSLGTLCEDMEAAAVAQVCDKVGFPFGCVRDISNNELRKITNKEMGEISSLDVGTMGARSAAVAIAAINLLRNR